MAAISKKSFASCLSFLLMQTHIYTWCHFFLVLPTHNFIFLNFFPVNLYYLFYLFPLILCFTYLYYFILRATHFHSSFSPSHCHTSNSIIHLFFFFFHNPIIFPSFIPLLHLHPSIMLLWTFLSNAQTCILQVLLLTSSRGCMTGTAKL